MRQPEQGRIYDTRGPLECNQWSSKASADGSHHEPSSSLLRSSAGELLAPDFSDHQWSNSYGEVRSNEYGGTTPSFWGTPKIQTLSANQGWPSEAFGGVKTVVYEEDIDEVLDEGATEREYRVSESEFRVSEVANMQAFGYQNTFVSLDGLGSDEFDIPGVRDSFKAGTPAKVDVYEQYASSYAAWSASIANEWKHYHYDGDDYEMEEELNIKKSKTAPSTMLERYANQSNRQRLRAAYQIEVGGRHPANLELGVPGIPLVSKLSHDEAEVPEIPYPQGLEMVIGLEAAAVRSTKGDALSFTKIESKDAWSPDTKTTASTPSSADEAEKAVRKHEQTILRIAQGMNWKKTLNMLQSIKDQNITPSYRAYTSAINTCAKNGILSRAVELFVEMRQANIEPTIVTYNSVIHASARAKKASVALDLLDQMTEANVMPDVISYSSAMSACSKSGRFAESFALFHRMKEQGLTPDLIIYSAAINSCEKARDVDQAMRFLEDMREQGLKGDVVTYNCAISVCDKAERWDDALNLMNEMKEIGVKPDVITYSSMISAFARCGKSDHALAMLREMEENNVEPNVITYSSAISACGNAGKWEESMSFLQKMKNSGIAPNVFTYTEVINACSKAQKWKQALVIAVNLMPRDGVKPDMVAYSACLSACEKSQRWEEALALKEEMMSKNETPDYIAYNALISASYSPAYPEYAVSLFHESYNLGLRSSFLKYGPASRETAEMVFEIDVLGFPLSIAQAGVRFVLEMFADSMPPQDLVVITGKHTCREGGSVLNAGLMRMCATEFNPPLDAAESRSNKGRLVISYDSIVSWLVANRQIMVSKKLTQEANAGRPGFLANGLPSFLHVLEPLKNGLDVLEETLGTRYAPVNPVPQDAGMNLKKKGGRQAKGGKGKGKGKGKGPAAQK